MAGFDKAIKEVQDMTGFDDRRLQTVRLLTIAAGVLSAIIGAGFLTVFSQHLTWQSGIPALTGVICTGMAILALTRLYPQRQVTLGLAGTGLAFGLMLISISAFISGSGLPAAAIFLIFSLILSASLPKEWQADLSTILGILLSGICGLLTHYSAFQQLEIRPAEILMQGIAGALFIIYVVMVVRQFIVVSLRLRLVTAFIGVVIVPLALLPIIQSQFMFNTLNDELNKSLLLAAQQTAIGIDKFLEDQQVSVTEAAKIDSLVRYLEIPGELRSGSSAEQEIRLALRVLDTQEISSVENLSSFALLDLEGNNLFDTLIDRYNGLLSAETRQFLGITTGDPGDETQLSESDQDYFLVPARAGVPYISPVLLPTSSRGFFYISAPVKNAKNQTVGVLRVRYDGLLLQDLLLRYKGLIGENSYPMLIDENNIRLADTFTPGFLYHSVDLLPESKANILKENRRLPDLPNHLLSTNFEEFGQALYNYESEPFFRSNIDPAHDEESMDEVGAIARIKSMPWKVVYLQANFSDEALRLTQRKLTTLVTALVAMFVGIIAVGAARLLSRPILRLATTAQEISEGNLDAQAPTQSADEFGMLGAAFNSMTSQLRMLISQLEARIKDRTQEIEIQNQALSHRARQLETVSQVARQIVTAQELDALLTSITHLISDRFGFYHVGIFLLDDNQEYAVLRAANSEGGQRMLARRHMLQVGKVGIVGYTTGTGQVRIATDVGEDAVFFNNPDLPDTRSEISLPLAIGNTIIGALDIQSTQPNAFLPEDVELLNTLANQVAVAIYNNRLYLDTLRALNEAENLHRQYLRSEWVEDAARRKVRGYVYNQAGILPQNDENPLWKQVFSTGEPVYAVLPSSNGSPVKALMAMPIEVRGETIGVIQVQDQGEDRIWSEDEIAVVNSIASQVAAALENARLFENTVRRAEREKKVSQITARIRSTNNPEEMMKIAINELQQALHATRTQIYIRQADQDPQPQSGDDVDDQIEGSFRN